MRKWFSLFTLLLIVSSILTPFIYATNTDKSLLQDARDKVSITSNSHLPQIIKVKDIYLTSSHRNIEYININLKIYLNGALIINVGGTVNRVTNLIERVFINLQIFLNGAPIIGNETYFESDFGLKPGFTEGTPYNYSYPQEKGKYHANDNRNGSTVFIEDPIYSNSSKLCMRMQILPHGLSDVSAKLSEEQWLNETNYAGDWTDNKRGYFNWDMWIDSNFTVGGWRMIWQDAGDSAPHYPQCALYFYSTGYLTFEIKSWATESNTTRQFAFFSISEFPKDQWVHFSMYFKQGSGFKVPDGTVKIWIDANMVFSRSDLETGTESGSPFIAWSICNYGDHTEEAYQRILYKNVKVTGQKAVISVATPTVIENIKTSVSFSMAWNHNKNLKELINVKLSIYRNGIRVVPSNITIITNATRWVAPTNWFPSSYKYSEGYLYIIGMNIYIPGQTRLWKVDVANMSLIRETSIYNNTDLRKGIIIGNGYLYITRESNASSTYLEIDKMDENRLTVINNYTTSDYCYALQNAIIYGDGNLYIEYHNDTTGLYNIMELNAGDMSLIRRVPFDNVFDNGIFYYNNNIYLSYYNYTSARNRILRLDSNLNLINGVNATGEEVGFFCTDGSYLYNGWNIYMQKRDLTSLNLISQLGNNSYHPEMIGNYVYGYINIDLYNFTNLAVIGEDMSANKMIDGFVSPTNTITIDLQCFATDGAAFYYPTLVNMTSPYPAYIYKVQSKYAVTPIPPSEGDNIPDYVIRQALFILGLLLFATPPITWFEGTGRHPTWIVIGFMVMIIGLAFMMSAGSTLF
jgi:hypothetical protein